MDVVFGIDSVVDMLVLLGDLRSKGLGTSVQLISPRLLELNKTGELADQLERLCGEVSCQSLHPEHPLTTMRRPYAGILVEFLRRPR